MCFASAFSLLVIVPALPVRAAVPGSIHSGPISTIDASFFISDLPISSLLGFLALVGLLWLGKRKKLRGWEDEKVGRETKKVRWWEDERVRRVKARISALGERLSALASRTAGNEVRSEDPGKLNELELRIEERPDGIIEHPPLRRRSTGSSASTDID